MSALIILLSLVIGYAFFMMSFYLLAKVLFPKMEDAKEEDIFITKKELRMQESARLERSQNKSFGLGKQPQVA